MSVPTISSSCARGSCAAATRRSMRASVDVVGLVEELAQQVELRREVVVERGDRHAGAGRHVADRRALVAVLAHDLDGGAHDRGLARPLALVTATTGER